MAARPSARRGAVVNQQHAPHAGPRRPPPTRDRVADWGAAARGGHGGGWPCPGADCMNILPRRTRRPAAPRRPPQDAHARRSRPSHLHRRGGGPPYRTPAVYPCGRGARHSGLIRKQPVAGVLFRRPDLQRTPGPPRARCLRLTCQRPASRCPATPAFPARWQPTTLPAACACFAPTRRAARAPFAAPPALYWHGRVAP